MRYPHTPPFHSSLSNIILTLPLPLSPLSLPPSVHPERNVAYKEIMLFASASASSSRTSLIEGHDDDDDGDGDGDTAADDDNNHNNDNNADPPLTSEAEMSMSEGDALSTESGWDSDGADNSNDVYPAENDNEESRAESSSSALALVPPSYKPRIDLLYMREGLFLL